MIPAPGLFSEKRVPLLESRQDKGIDQGCCGFVYETVLNGATSVKLKVIDKRDVLLKRF